LFKQGNVVPSLLLSVSISRVDCRKQPWRYRTSALSTDVSCPYSQKRQRTARESESAAEKSVTAFFFADLLLSLSLSLLATLTKQKSAGDVVVGCGVPGVRLAAKQKGSLEEEEAATN
jgi:hypothetical protein